MNLHKRANAKVPNGSTQPKSSKTGKSTFPVSEPILPDIMLAKDIAKDLKTKS